VSQLHWRSYLFTYNSSNVSRVPHFPCSAPLCKQPEPSSQHVGRHRFSELHTTWTASVPTKCPASSSIISTATFELELRHALSEIVESTTSKIITYEDILISYIIYESRIKTNEGFTIIYEVFVLCRFSSFL
jgi:hypothetical protein